MGVVNIPFRPLTIRPMPTIMTGFPDRGQAGKALCGKSIAPYGMKANQKRSWSRLAPLTPPDPLTPRNDVGAFVSRVTQVLHTIHTISMGRKPSLGDGGITIISLRDPASFHQFFASPQPTTNTSPTKRPNKTPTHPTAWRCDVHDVNPLP